MHRGYYITVGVFSISAMAASVWLLPDSKEVALMHMEDKYYGQAFEDYERLYAEGDRSINVIIPLSKLYLQTGDVEKAIPLMEDLAARHPESLEVRQQLGVLYQYAQMPDKFLANLEAIYAFAPSINILRDLSDSYNFRAQYDQQIRVLELLIADYGDNATEEDYRNLAYLYSDQKRLADAGHLLEAYILLSPKEVSQHTAVLAVSVLLDINETERAQALAHAYLEPNPDAERVLEIARQFRLKKTPASTVTLLEEYTDDLENSPQMYEEHLVARIQKGEKNAVYATLQRRFELGMLTDNTLSLLTSLAVEKEDITQLMTIADKGQLTHIEESVLTETILALWKQDKTEHVRRMATRLGDAYLEYSPMLQAVLMLAQNGTENAAPIIAADELTAEQRILLAQFYLKAHKYTEAIALLEELPADQMLAQIGSAVYASAMLEMQQGDVALERLQAAQPDKNVTHASLLLAAALGKKEAITDTRYNLLKDENILTALYDMAEHHGHKDVAYELAQKLYAQKPSAQHALRLAQYHQDHKNYVAALPLLREAKTVDANAERAYLDTLTQLAQNTDELSYRTELRQAVGDWRKRQGISAKDRREVAYNILNAGLKPEAAAIFQALAQHASPSHKDVQQLLFLWGEMPNSAQRQWIITRATSAPSDDKAAWLTILNRVKEPGAVLALVEKEPQPWDAALLEIYLEALTQAGDKPKLHAVLKDALQHDYPPQQLQRFAQMAINESQHDVAIPALQRLHALAPDDDVLAEELATLLFYEQRYADASPLFAQAVEGRERPYRTHYYYAEILWLENRKAAAREQYAVANRLLQKQNAPLAIEERRILANIHFKRQQDGKALAILRDAFHDHPTHAGIRTELANMLIDSGRYQEAERVLSDVQ